MILDAVQAGECVSVVGLSGAGKSNLLGFLAYHLAAHPEVLRSPMAAALVDCNRLTDLTPSGFFRLARGVLGEAGEAADEFAVLDAVVSRQLEARSNLCLLFDLSGLTALTSPTEQTLPVSQAIFSNLRALRDAHKYALTYVAATRRPLAWHSELAELFYANTIWLGPLSESDARWNVARYAARRRATWDEAVTQALIAASAGYPAFLRAVCEAYAGGASLELSVLRNHPAVRRRVEEFWADKPSDDDIRQSGLAGCPLLLAAPGPAVVDFQLTAKEHLLLEYFRAHPDAVCDKDELIRAVWPEDKIFERGIRDDSLAQLIRRLREKIETNPSSPQYIHTVPGRGYRYTPGR
jgi:hypothetical protein